MPLRRRRILCVEDHEDTRLMLSNLLEREGYDVMTAENAAEGLNLAKDDGFDLLIIDIWLPDESGNKLCRRVREFEPYTPIIVYSGAVSEKDQQNARLSEVDAFVAKPNIDDLLDKVRYFLD